MIKGDDRRAIGEAPQCLKVVVATEHHIRCDLGSRLMGVQGEHPEADAQCGRGRRGHPGQLTAADHAHAQDTGGLGHGATLPR